MSTPANHGKPWSAAAEATVRNLWVLRATIADTMMAMGREAEAIKARLERLGIMRWTGFSREETGKAKRQAPSEEQQKDLWLALSEAYHTYNPNGVWHSSTGHKEPAPKAECYAKAGGVPAPKSEYKILTEGLQPELGVVGTANLRNGGLVTSKSRWASLSPADEPGWFKSQFLTKDIDPSRKIDCKAVPCTVQHVVNIEGEDFDYTPALKEQILRHVYGGSSARSRGVGDIQDAMAYALTAHKSQGGGYISTATQPQQEKPMSVFTSITTHFVNGNDASKLSDDELFAQLARGEQQLDKLKAIKTPSKKLAAQIEDMQDQLTKLAEYIDSRK